MNRKGALSYDALTAIFSFILIAGIFYVAMNVVNTTNAEVDIGVNLINYEFPQLYTLTFLNSQVEINESVREMLNLNLDKPYRVKDIIVFSNDVTKEIIETARDEYIENELFDDSNMYNNFEVFTSIVLEENNLLQIEYLDDLSSVTNLNQYLLQGNYYYVLKSVDEGFVVIYFNINSGIDVSSNPNLNSL